MSLLLHVEREPSLAATTIGQLTVEDQVGRLAWTLEDEVREIPGEPVETWKIPGATAIPAGRYRVAITFSQRFQRRMPVLLNVAGFTGIRIHSGNTAADTEGCILVGLTRVGPNVYQSRAAFKALYERIEVALLAAEEVWVTVGTGEPKPDPGKTA